MATWILTADRAGARIFERNDAELSVTEEIVHEEGRLKDSELNSDRPGRSFDRRGVGRHAMSRPESPHERVASNFARTLAHKLNDGRVHGRFTRLVMAAEPGFLGLLREALDPETARMLVGSLPKDLQHMRPEEVAPHVLPLLA